MHLTPGLREPLVLGGTMLRWVAIALPLGVVVGSAVALFLWSLDRVTQARFDHPWLLWLLPVAGAAIGWMYLTVGSTADGGNNLVVDAIHDEGGGVPLRMAPLVLIGTLATHLCGGSAGREGTAVQMGAGLAGGLIRWLPGLDRRDAPTILMAGIAAGFGGVFGTPIAGTIFALEVLAIGRMRYGGILPCLVAAIAADRTCLAWGIGHTHYEVASLVSSPAAAHPAPFAWPLLGWAVVGGILFGLASMLFSELTHAVHAVFRRLVGRPLLRPVVGGCLVIALVWLLGTRDYLGLGVTNPDPDAVSITTAFQAGGARPWSWLWKIIFTAVTLGAGFKGGEVTPLFFIGATLGNTLAVLGNAPVDFLAALGFVAVFAGATNTPIACTVMAVELFGGGIVVHAAVACVLAYLCSGHTGIYLAQRIDTPKLAGRDAPLPSSLRDARAARSRR